MTNINVQAKSIHSTASREVTIFSISIQPIKKLLTVLCVSRVQFW